MIKADSLTRIPECYYDSFCYDPDDNIVLNGLSATVPFQSIGAAYMDFFFENNDEKSLEVKLHIIQEETNIPYDGIIGSDFLLKSEHCIIDFKKLQVRLTTIPNPINLYLDKVEDSAEIPTQILKARSETVIEVDILNPEIKEGITPKLSIHDGVYLAKSILRVNSEGRCFTTILNTLDKEVKVKKLKLFLEPFDNQQSSIFTINTVSNNRHSTLKEHLRLDHLNPEEKHSIIQICNKYNDVFYLPNDNLTATDVVTHSIKVTDPTPVVTKMYRFPESLKPEVNRQINKMLHEKIIRPSVSPYNSPLWIVPKKTDASGEKKWRIVIDYRKLNTLTVGDSFPIPNIEEILDQLGHSTYFTTLDLCSGFHQIKMTDDTDMAKTAFSTPTGHYEYTRMPFGLKNAPSTFARAMSTALAGLQGNQCFVYLDDIIIYASSVEEHSKKLTSVFDRLRTNKLLLQPDKCEFMRKEVAYLGHVISDQGVSPQPNKITAISNYPVPKNQKNIKQFLGLVGYYRRFIENFSKIARPLTKLLRKDQPFLWSDEQQVAFDFFRNALTSEPILQFPDFSKEFILTTDASNFAIGAILSQGEPGKDLPIAYASRTLNKAEINYSTIEHELLAIVWAVQHFRPYLFGRKFTIYTDHRPLAFLFNCKNQSSRLLRWRLKLEEYEYTIKYKAGKTNQADALSRNVPSENIYFQQNNLETYEQFIKFHYENQNLPEVQIIKENIFQKFPNGFLYSKDLHNMNQNFENLASLYDFDEISKNLNQYDILSLKNANKNTYLGITKLNYFDKLSYNDLFYTLRNLREKLKHDKISVLYLRNPLNTKNPNLKQEMFNELVYFLFKNSKIKIVLVNRPRITPVDSEIKNIFQENHDSSVSGHSGFLRTYKRIRENYKWKHMKTDIKNLIKSCQSCQINKTNHKPGKAPMEITTTSHFPFQRLGLDIVGPLPVTEQGNRFILTMQDDLTKYSYAVPIPDHEAKTIADSFVSFIALFGIPESILTDQGSDFTSNLFKEVNKLFKIKHILSSPYHPQTQGALERSHLTLKDYLKHYICTQQTNWDEYVSLAMFSYNTHFHKSTQYTPFELIFGRKASIPNSLTMKPEFKYTYDDYYSNLKLKLNKSFEIAREKLISAKEKSKVHYDTKINKHNFKIGNLVYVYNKSIKKGISKKLQPNYKGPYKIIKINPNNSVALQINNKIITYHHNLLKPFISDTKSRESQNESNSDTDD